MLEWRVAAARKYRTSLLDETRLFVCVIFASVASLSAMRMCSATHFHPRASYICRRSKKFCRNV